MQIVLSAHFDIAKPVPYITLENGKLQGLIDNFAGVFVAYEASKKQVFPFTLQILKKAALKALVR
jgi:hypothetical protein